MTEQLRLGYLVLADISGYTSFLAKVEIEHAHEILTDLLETLVKRFQSLLTISKLEGDAVFAFVEENKVPRGETVLELIESTYADFRQRRDTSKRVTTCNCRACQSMPSLELKFFVHYGSFMVQHVAGIRELLGSDVNLIHRLTKNHITDQTGWRAYALFTQRALETTQLELEDVHEQMETYEHLGDIETVTIDLLPRYDILIAKNIYFIPLEEADANASHTYKLSDAELWQVITSTDILNAVERNRVTWSPLNRPGGRTGIGASNHCAHSKGFYRETIVDWHPFHYYTGHGVGGPFAFYAMYEITPLADGQGSVLTNRWKMDPKLPRWICKLFGALVVKKGLSDYLQRIETYIENAPQPTFQEETA